ncbi:DUF3124 domain-containing protein [Roseibium sp.]|uniref:DUF3124 domain-containing protein n=1 Tax=Roseibium sp. TaxID=1936156 RepID=UPI0032659B5D
MKLLRIMSKPVAPLIRWFGVVLLAAGMTVGVSEPSVRAENLDSSLLRSLGETYYVPAYSRIQTFSDRSVLLAATLTVHNVDPQTDIFIEKVSYHDETGKEVRVLTTEAIKLAPFASHDFLVQINDQTGGRGANFIATWQSELPALSPIVEAVMTGGAGTPSPSFTSRGRVIERQSVD